MLLASTSPQDPDAAPLDIERRVFPRDTPVPKAQLVGSRELLERVLSALREAVALDLVFDDIEAALGERPPTAGEVAELAPRLRKAVPQLVDILLERSGAAPSEEATVAVERSRAALAESTPTDPAAARGLVRRLALAAQDVLDLLVGDEE
jgi:hypothetical protein